MMVSEFPQLPDPDYNRGLKEATKDTFLQYRGFVILKTDGGYKWRDDWYQALSSVYVSVDHYIEKLTSATGVKDWEISIVHKDGSETILTDKYKERYLQHGSPYTFYKQNQQ